MIDERAELERAVRRFRPDPGIVERVHERRRRQQRNSRIAAAIVAVVIFGATVGGAVAVLRSRTLPVHEPPVGAIQMHNGPIDVFGYIGGIRSVGTDGTVSSVVRCGGACTEIGGASWSPDGTRLAFVAECAGACASIGHPYHGIRIFDQDGDRLILPTEFVGALAWSPDGTRIAFATDVTYSPETRTTTPGGGVWIMSADGSDVAQLTHATSPNSISWSPDGSRLVYTDRREVFILGLDGSAPVPLVRGDGAAWSPDGDTIAYLSRCDVRVTTPEGLHDRSLVDLRSVKPETAGCGFLGKVVWSPDGKKLAASASRRSAGRRVSSRVGLFDMNADGSNARLVSDHVNASGLTWQPVP
jgi:dipeptidyl aminopeptidase/acylaminoacyl peptidase